MLLEAATFGGLDESSWFLVHIAVFVAAVIQAATARKLGLDCHIRLEERVARDDPAYRNSGNVLLDRLLGATLHSFPNGEDEAGADRGLAEICADLEATGRRPYVISLGPDHPPLGALGYVVASGSGNTHAGLLFGLRALGSTIPVTGVCVRRKADLQAERIQLHGSGIAELLQVDVPFDSSDVILLDEFLAPGYGQFDALVVNAIQAAAQCEGLFLDPVYTGKAMAGLISRSLETDAAEGRKLLFIHTGGQPALFAYEEQLTSSLRGDGAG